MRLYIFNPEHDIALAHGSACFTAPKAGRLLRSDLGYLAALWAEEGGVVWVNDSAEARERIRDLQLPLPNITFVDNTLLRRMACGIRCVEPWGWDAALRHSLLRLGVSENVLPTPTELEEIRRISHRKSSQVLQKELEQTSLKTRLIGESIEVKDEDELRKVAKRWISVVLKAPWSSSGRGVRMVSEPFDASLLNWAKGVIARQGSIMVEPLYDKILDFGMEFVASDSKVRYVGLSLFHTIGAAYTGNLLADEKSKREILSRYVNLSIIDFVREVVQDCFHNLFPQYRHGPFGIDMMLVRGTDGSTLVHPAVEINFRRTMGHVAIDLQKLNPCGRSSMSVAFDGTKYQLALR